MKAKALRFLVEGFLFVAATLAIAPASSMAMGDKVGDFSLPVAVQWGDVVLPPGAYTISAANSGSSHMMCVYRKGASETGYFMPAVVTELTSSHSSQTQIVFGEKEGTVYVRELKLGGEGMDLYYAPPKAKK